MEIDDEPPSSDNPGPQTRLNTNGEPSRLNPYSLYGSRPGPSSQPGRRIVKHGPENRPPPQNHNQPNNREHSESPPPPQNRPTYTGPVVSYQCSYLQTGPMPFTPQEYLQGYANPRVTEVVDLDSDSSEITVSDGSIDEEDDESDPIYIKTEPREQANENKDGCSSSKQETVEQAPQKPPRRPIWPLPDGPIKTGPEDIVLKPLIETRKQARKYKRYQRTARRIRRMMRQEKAMAAFMDSIVLPDDGSSDEVELLTMQTKKSPQAAATNTGAEGNASTSHCQRPQPSTSAQSGQGSLVARRRSERLLGRESAAASEPQPSTSAEGMRTQPSESQDG